MLTLQTLRDAHDRIRPYIHRTPALTCQTIDRMAGAQLVFKCENFQKIGAFKARGGMNAALQLTEAERTYGEQYLEEKLSPYLKTPLPRSDDNEPTM